jgi:hypothetical protein
VLELQRMAGNAAVKRIARQPKGERWFRGQASDVPRTKPGQVVHDLGDGVYYTSGAGAAESYGKLREKDNPGSQSSTGGFVVDTKSLGRVLDLTKDHRWADFLRSKPLSPSMGSTWREYMSRTTEFYNAGFGEFLRRHNIKHTTIGGHISSLPDFDVVIAEDLIRNPKTRQMVVMNAKIVERVDAMTKSVHVVGANKEPAPVGVGSGAGGGRLPDAPQLHLDRSGRVRLYRVITNAELQSLARHGDFNFAPSGGGKYFSFNRTDALKLGAKSPGGASAHTLIVVSVPRSFLPDKTDVVHEVNQPHLPARGGQASMIRGEVIIQVDRGGAGWALHVDDEALTAMNKVMTRPEIVSSPSTATVKAPAGGGKPPDKPPDKPPPKDTPKETPKPPATTGSKGGPATGRGNAPMPIQTPEPAQRMHQRRGTLGAGATMLLGLQLNAFRGAEKQKAVNALEELTPRIEAYRAKGMYVTVTIEVDVPDKVDIAAIWAGIGDPSQIVYFRRMWIANAAYPVKEAEPPPPGQKKNYKEPQQLRQNEATDEPRQKEWYLQKKREGWHAVTRDMHLPPTQRRAEDAGKKGPAAPLIFRPVEVRDNQPQNNFDNVGENRLITIDAEQGLQMWNTYYKRGYKRVDTPSGSDGSKWVPQKAKFTNDAEGGRHTLESLFDWQQGQDGRTEIQEVADFRNKEFYDRSYTVGVRWVRD